MKYSLLLVALLSSSSLMAVDTVQIEDGYWKTDAAPQASAAPQEAVQGEPVESPVQVQAPQAASPAEMGAVTEPVLTPNKTLRISVTGQGVSPINTASPAQAYALAKRAAISDAYRMIAERVRGVRIDGQDLIKNMMVKRSTIRTSVNAMVKNANVVETTFKEGLCEVEMEIVLSYSQFAQ